MEDYDTDFSVSKTLEELTESDLGQEVAAVSGNRMTRGQLIDYHGGQAELLTSDGSTIFYPLFKIRFRP